MSCHFDGTSREIILTSACTPITDSNDSTTSAVEFILKKIEENVQNGYKDWLTNSVTGETLELSECEPYSRSVASALVKRGLRQGDVAIYMTNDVTRIYAIIIGVWRIGGIMYSYDSEDSYDKLSQQIKDAKVRWIFCDPESVSHIKDTVAQFNWTIEIFVFGNGQFTTSVDDLFLDDGKDCPEILPFAGLDEPILIVNTSATMGPSKSVVHTNKSVLGYFMMESSMPKSSKLHMILSRCINISGIFNPLGHACKGYRGVMMPKITTENILNCINNFQPAVAIGFPWFFEMLTSDPRVDKYDLSSVETVCVSGAVMTESFYNSMLKFPNLKEVINIYAFTECGRVATNVISLNESPRKASKYPLKLSVGRLLPNTELKIIDLDTGLSVGPMTRGEVLLRSLRVANGYWNRPQETALTFIDGWVKTGDLGYYDDDKNIFIINRIRDIFKYQGQYIYPSELEAIILEHPAVSQVSVFGVVDPTGVKIPRAIVVLKPGESDIKAEGIRKFADGKLLDYQQLRGGLYIADSLPRGPTGKILKHEAAKHPV